MGDYFLGQKGNSLNMIVYDTQFNANEWFVITGFCTGYLLMFILPKRFPLKTTVIFATCGIYNGFMFDHSLSVEPVDFYDVNDSSNYEFFDFISYLMYGPWSYLFFYVWDWLRFNFRFAPLYIFLWGAFSFGLERLAVLCNVYHYKNGYEFMYSFPIYLVAISFWAVLYYFFKGKQLSEK